MFRSEVPCPIDLYYVGVDTDWNTPSGHAMPKAYMDVIAGTELDKSAASTGTAIQAVGDDGTAVMVGQHPPDAGMCQEVHSFHLGVNPATSNPEVPAGPFEAWDSPIAYLFTYTSHKFVARLRHDKTLVDAFSIERTVVGDCPRERKKNGVGSSVIANGVGVLIGGKDNEDEDELVDENTCKDILIKNEQNSTATLTVCGTNTTKLTPSPSVSDKVKDKAAVCTSADSDSNACKGIKDSVPQASSVKVGSPVP